MIFIYDANAYLQAEIGRWDPSKTGPRFTYESALQCPHPQVWVWDGFNNNARRRAIFPGYKIRDTEGKEDIFAGLRLYRDILACAPCTQIEVPEWEADDVCATLARYFTSKGEPVTIFTNDFDYFQLTVDPYVRLQGVKDKGIPPHLIRLYKTLVGDQSDRIPGVPGFGPKTWDSFSGIYELADQAFREGNRSAIRDLPFKPKPRAWLAEDENLDLALSFYAITALWDVPMDLIEKHSRVGTANWQGANELFQRFML